MPGQQYCIGVFPAVKVLQVVEPPSEELKPSSIITVLPVALIGGETRLRRPQSRLKSTGSQSVFSLASCCRSVTPYHLDGHA